MHVAQCYTVILKVCVPMGVVVVVVCVCVIMCA
jgi:hypothetical protein